MRFGEKLQKLRKASGMNQESLADKLNVSRQAVSKWESGASYPEMDKLIQMSKLFECTLDELVNDTDTDKSIIKNNVSKKNMYLDSLMEFITKSVSMFSNMKFSNLIKSFLELGIMGVIIFVIGYLTYLFGEIFLDQVIFAFSNSNEVVWSILAFIDNILSTVLLFVIIILCLLIYLQIYKIRYLDYYDKLVYETNQMNRLDVENVENEDKSLNKKEVFELEEKRNDKIVIRDPNHRPFAFLSPLAKVITGIFKVFVGIFSLAFIASLIFFVVALILSLYLLSINKIFIGIVIGLIGLIIFNVLLLEILYKFIVHLVINKKRVFIEVVMCVVISSVGLGITLIGLKDFDIYYDDSELVSEVVSFDNAIDIIDFNNYYNVNLIVSDTLGDDLKIEYHFDKELIDYSIEKVDNVISINVDEKYNGFREYVQFALDNLKNNKYKLEYYTGYPIVIRGSMDNIYSIVKYYRDNKGVIFVDYNNDGYFFN